MSAPLPSEALAFQHLLHAALEGVWVIDADRCTTYVNDRMAAILGYAPDEMVGRHAFDFMDAEARGPAEAALTRRASGVAEFQEFRFLAKDGASVWTLMGASPLMSPAGAFCGAVAFVTDISERRRAEAELREQRVLYEQVLASLHQGLAVYDYDGRYRYLNPTLTDWMGPDGPDAVGRLPSDHRPPDGSAPGVGAYIRRALDGESVQMPDVRSRVGGADLWVSPRFDPLRDAEGAIVGAIGSHLNVTDRVESERAREATEERFRRCIYWAPVPAFLHADDGTILAHSVTLCELTGYTAGELPTTEAWARRAFANDPEAALRRIRARYGLARRTDEGEFRVLTRSGDPRDWLFSSAPLGPDERGRQLVLTVCTDVTDRNATRRELGRRTEQFEALASTSADMIARVDAEGRLLYVNEALAAPLNLDPADFVGRLPEEMGMPAEAARLRHDAVRRVVETGLPVRHDFAMDVPEWGERHFEASLAPESWVGGQVATLLVITRDVTRRVLRERELERLSRRLVETQEAERRAIALELHDAIGQSLLALKLTLDAAPTAGTPGSAVAEARALSDDLLDRVRALSLDLRPSALDDLGLMPALLMLVRRYTARTGIHVRVDHSDVAGRRFEPAVETAAFRIAQEALSNVARHAGVHEAALRVDAGGPSLRVAVSDAGVGFDPGRLGPETTGVSGIRERATLVGGAVELTTAPGRGTRVVAVLPIAGPP